MNFRNLDELNFRLKVSDISGLSESAKKGLRRECQTNLRFLVNCVLRPTSARFLALSERVHGGMIDSFLQPSPDLDFSEWSPKKERVTLASRGYLKSTVSPGFIVQCILCDPDLRILIVSGKLPLAKTILETVRQPFATNEVIKSLFPEWAISTLSLAGDTFDCPHRNPDLNLRDPTLSIATFESVKAGGHYELVMFDDCTNEINCASQEMAEKNQGYYDDTDPLVEPGGYRHFLGTRWADDLTDLPEVIRRRGEAVKEETGESSVSYFFMPAWTLKAGRDETERQEIQERDRKDCLRPEDVDLTWPEKLTAKVLFPKYRKNPKKFNLQYLLRYRDSSLVEAVTEDLLTRNTRPYAEGIPLPHDRFMVMNWDLGNIWSGIRNQYESDFSCGLAAMYELSTRRMFVYDAVLEVFTFSGDAAQAIVGMFKRQLRIGPLEYCDIEDHPGARNLEGEILYYAKVTNTPIKIRYQPISRIRGAKVLRISKSIGAMKRGLVQFSTSLPRREDIFEQYTKWKPTSKSLKDDGPDCAAQLWDNYSDKIFPKSVEPMRPSNMTSFIPDVMTAETAPVDDHADEREYADIEWLSQMTVPHV